MNRRLIHLLIAAFVLLTLVVALYFFFKPREREQSFFNQLNENRIEYAQLIDHLSAEPKAFFFCTLEDPDCLYINNEILDALLSDANTDRFSQITFVDASAIGTNVLPSAIKASLGFSKYPAFALLSRENNRILVHSVYEWSEDRIFTVLDLKAWMSANGLWLPEYTN